MRVTKADRQFAAAVKKLAEREFIYFIQSGPGGPVKIGYTRKAKARWRMIGLQVGNPEPLSLLAVIEGKKDEELRTHAEFHELRIRGEWFRYEEPLVSYIARLVSVADAWLGPLE